MSNLSEDEIIYRVMMIDQWKTSGDIYTQDELNAIGQFIDLYNKELENSTKLNLENQALYESINCNDDNMLAREYKKLKEKYKLLDEKFRYAVPDNMINELYVSKDKIKAKIKEFDKTAYEEQIKPLKDLLKE